MFLIYYAFAYYYALLLLAALVDLSVAAMGTNKGKTKTKTKTKGKGKGKDKSGQRADGVARWVATGAELSVGQVSAYLVGMVGREDRELGI